MKPTDRDEPRPWREAAGDATTVEAEIGRATRLLSKPALPNDVRLAHIRAEILSRRGPAVAAGHLFYRRVSPWVLAASCILFGSLATAIAGMAYLRHQRAAAAPKVTSQPLGKGAPGAVATGPVAPTELPAASLEPATAPSAPRAVTRVRPAARAKEQPESESAFVETQPPALTPAPGDGARGEASQLGDALRALRVDGDARRALAILEDHDTRFPAGALHREATLARVEALAALGRRSDALKALDAVKMEGGELDRSVALLRAELRAAAQRYAEAVDDFSTAIAGAGSDEIAERALYGRGVCRLRGGDRLGARADLERYQRQFPNGRHNTEVARVLDGLAR